MNHESFETEVAVLGGGIIGLVNALQYARRGIDVVLIDNFATRKRSYKVGESLLVFSSAFLRTIGGLDEYLTTEAFPKHGIWFTYGMEGRSSFHERSEWALETSLPSSMRRSFGDEKLARCVGGDCQIVRPEVEDVLLASVRAHPRIRVLDTVLARDVSLGEGSEPHVVTWECKVTGGAGAVRARWVIDCSGRSRFLAKKFKHAVEPAVLADGFHTTAVWAQFDSIDDSQFAAWRTTSADGLPAERDLNTVHLWGDHYWIWVIRLSKGRISVGVTYDQRHPPPGADFRAQFWDVIRRYPLFDRVLAESNLLEFRSYKNVQHLTDTFVSSRRYAMAGDAGSIIDAYYSQGMSLAFVTSWHVANIVQTDLRRGALDTEYIDRVNTATQADWLMLRNMLLEKYTTAIRDGRFFVLSHLLDMTIIGGLAADRVRLARWLVATEGGSLDEGPELEAIRADLSKGLFFSRAPLWSFVSPDTAQRIQRYLQERIGERARWRLENGVETGRIRCILRVRLGGLMALWKLPDARGGRFVDISPSAPDAGAPRSEGARHGGTPRALKLRGPLFASLFLCAYGYDWFDTQRAKLSLSLRPATPPSNAAHEGPAKAVPSRANGHGASRDVPVSRVARNELDPTP